MPRMPRVLGVISGTENQPSSWSFSFQSVFLKRRSWRSGVGQEIKEDSEEESRRRRKGGKPESRGDGEEEETGPGDKAWRVQGTRGCVLATPPGWQWGYHSQRTASQGLMMVTRLGGDRHLDMLSRPSSIMACTTKPAMATRISPVAPQAHSPFQPSFLVILSMGTRMCFQDRGSCWGPWRLQQTCLEWSGSRELGWQSKARRAEVHAEHHTDWACCPQLGRWR